MFNDEKQERLAAELAEFVNNPGKYDEWLASLSENERERWLQGEQNAYELIGGDERYLSDRLRACDPIELIAPMVVEGTDSLAVHRVHQQLMQDDGSYRESFYEYLRRLGL